MDSKIDSIRVYAEAITNEFNKHAEPLKDWEKLGLFEQGFHAFMCNAINGAVLRSQTAELKEYFNAYAITD